MEGFRRQSCFCFTLPLTLYISRQFCDEFHTIFLNNSCSITNSDLGHLELEHGVHLGDEGHGVGVGVRDTDDDHRTVVGLGEGDTVHCKGQEIRR